MGSKCENNMEQAVLRKSDLKTVKAFCLSYSFLDFLYNSTVGEQSFGLDIT